MGSFDDWTAQRQQSVTSPAGNLALVAYQLVTSADPVPIEMIPASVRLVDGFDGVEIDAAESAGLAVDGLPVVGPTKVARLRQEGTPLITWRQYSVDVFSLDGTDHELRIYDAESPNRQNFEGIAVYQENHTWCLRGYFRAFRDTEQVPWAFTRSLDTGHTKSVPGAVQVTIDGDDYELLAFLDGSRLVLVFADETNGAESYGAGRFLQIPAPDAEGRVDLDFNRAFIPPCGFSEFYSCPLPPAQNRIATAVRAGERQVRWKRPATH